MLVVHQYDHVYFRSIRKASASVYETDEHGKDLARSALVFQPQANSVNYFRRVFDRVGMYYFATDHEQHKRPSSSPFAVLVLPEIRFHYKFVHLNDFDWQVLITNVYDFIIWQFEQTVRFGMVQLRSNESLEDLASCHDRAVAGRHRQCLAVECIVPGAFYFANPGKLSS